MKPRPRFLTADWRYLTMLNYPVDPGILQGRVPHGCELDTWDGHTFVSVVGFLFLRTRVLGIPVPFHRDFEEVNLRFYVRRRVEGAWRRGVVFVKELVPLRAIAWVARAAYGENYIALPMRHELHLSSFGEAADVLRVLRVSSVSTVSTVSRVAYEWQRGGAWESVRASFRGASKLPAEDSEEAFITEHYWGYAAQGERSTVEYQVEHPRWRVWRAVEASFEADVGALYGAEFAESLAAAPSTAFVADGSEIVVRRGTSPAR